MDSLAAQPRSVWHNRSFLMVLVAAFVSNMGRWMQQVTLGILAWEMTGSAALTTQVIFAQFIPMLVLGPVGGAAADVFDRRWMLIVAQIWQAVWSLVLALNLVDGEISAAMLLGLVFIGGLAMPFYAPTFAAVIPSLVGRHNIATAVSLSSVQLNGSRVVGPMIGAWLATVTDIWVVLVVTTVGFLVTVTILSFVRLPIVEKTEGISHLQRFVSGFRIAAAAEQIRRPLLIMSAFALLCLPFVGLLPVIAGTNLGIEPRSEAYGLLYAIFGLGALVGALAVGTVLKSLSAQLVVRVSLMGFAASLAVLALLRDAAFAYPVMFVVGMFYFTMPTALMTFMQLHLKEEIRGRVMALWMLSFGGVVPVTNLIAGPLVELTSLTTVLAGGVVSAVGLAVVSRLRSGPEYGEQPSSGDGALAVGR